MSFCNRGQFSFFHWPALLAMVAVSAVSSSASFGAESLPPLRADPSLLGGAALPPEPPATSTAAPDPAIAPATSAAPVVAAPATSASTRAPARAPRPEASAPTAQARPTEARQTVVTLPPLRVDPALLGGTTTSVAAQSPASAPVVSAPPPAPAATDRRPVIAKQTAKSLPPLRVDPTLLGSGEATSGVLAQSREPPQVAESPVLPPTYSAYAEAGLLPGPSLKSAKRLVPHTTLPDEALPTFIAADQIAGKTDVEVAADGNVELRRRGTVMDSDRLTYWQATDEVEAEGNVNLFNEGAQVNGPKLRMKMGETTGFFEQPIYSIRQPKTGTPPVLWTAGEEPDEKNLTTGQGYATRLDFEGKGKYRLTDATYSTCTPAEGSSPDWFARTANLRLDYDEQVGTANNATVYFKGMPLMYTPWMDFALNNQRKSGLLTPTFGSTTRGGLEYTQPIYWNIAPNMDATIAPRLITRRGVLWNGEYRYLEPNYSGTFQGQLLPNDRLEDKRRSAFSLNHVQNFGYGITGSLDISNASDGTYFSDLGNNSAIIAQTNLLRQGTLNYSASWWSASVLAQSYKTLQDPALPTVLTPYQRLPQINVNAERSDLPFGLDFVFAGEHVNFRNASSVSPLDGTPIPEGRRVTLYPQISLPLQTAAFYLTPKIGVHSTRYQLENQALGTPDKLTRNIPIASIDSGVVFERPSEWFDTALTQTLEPRLFYLYIPSREQSQIPVFDSALADFNFAQIFAENRYSGGDRIGDANQLTGMLTSRLLDPETGAELLRAAFGQRLYFTTQHVGLPGEKLRTDRQTDLLGSFSGQVLPKTYIDTSVQYNTRQSVMERLNIGGRYQPEIGKVLNAGYRYTRDQLGQVDVSGQWPFANGWHGVGRYNYSTREKRLIESVVGLEYDGGCWVGRVVVQRLATQVGRVNNSLFFQLELNGFARLGSNPLELLKRTVPGYGIINRPDDDPQLMTQQY
jgi:LPS-assembly protein